MRNEDVLRTIYSARARYDRYQALYEALYKDVPAPLRKPRVISGPCGATPTVEVHANITTIGLEGFLRRSLKRTEVRRGRPPVATLSQVIAHPRYTALYDVTGKIIPESSIFVMPPNAPEAVKDKFRTAPEKELEPETIGISDLDVCNETVVFGGAPHAHFGHHLLDGMSRLWYHSTKPTLYLDALLKARKNPPFPSEYLALGRPRQIYDLQKPTLFARLILPEASVQNAFVIYGICDTEHRAIMRSALTQASRPVPSKIYLSRRGVANRKCHGEEELERRLSSHGFAIVRPETLPIVDQICIFNLADWIVGPSSSAFHNLLFMGRGASTKTVQFTWEKPDLRDVMIDRVKGHTSYFARTMSSEVAEGQITSTRIDVEQSLFVLQAIGALPKWQQRWSGLLFSDQWGS